MKSESVVMLDELGYTVYREPFDRFGLVRSKHDPSQPFEFLEQDHYEMIGDLVVKHVQELMIKEYGSLLKFLLTVTSREIKE